MSTYRFEHILSPASIAVVGASEREGSLGGIVLQELKRGGFKGPLFAVNPKRASVHGVPCFKSLELIGRTVDLAIIATPPSAVPAVIEDAIAHGVRAAVVITAGLGRGEDSIASSILAMARKAGLRLVGPNCLGVLSPGVLMNASFAPVLPERGPVALISQSGAIAVGLVAWASRHGVGFSGVVSLGDAIDVDIGDCLDYFGEDPATRVIILYAEGISDARKFMSAARKAARVKPVIVLKAGRHLEGAKAAATHTGALAGSDTVYGAAFARAGLLRVADIDELYATLEALSSGRSARGDRLAIVTNGGGLGVLAVDRVIDLGGKLAALSDETILRLDEALPPTWSRRNPIDIIGDAPAERYVAALQGALDDDNVDALLVMNCPTAVTSPDAAAQAVAAAVGQDRKKTASPKPVAAMWMGAEDRIGEVFKTAGIPHFGTETDAVFGLVQLMRQRTRQDALLAAPAHLPAPIEPDRRSAELTVARCLADARDWLDPIEVKDLLSAYGIPTANVRLARSADDASLVAADMLGSVKALAVKIHSRDIVHKSDVDGVRLGLATPDATATAAAEILERAARLRPEARIVGVTIHPMIETLHARELIVGMTVDPTFGPVLLFGHGGTALEVINDKALDLLPVDLDQARKLINSTRVARLLAGYRNIPPADREQLALLLVRVSRLVEDNPEIIGLDLNPVLCDAKRIIALDARVQVAPLSGADRAREAGRRFAIRPYPRHLEQMLDVKDRGRIELRPLRPTDDEALATMLLACSAEDLRKRFLGTTRPVDRRLVSRLTQLDYAREMAFVALDPDDGRFRAVVRLHGDASGEKAEFAILVRTDAQGHGLGYALIQRIIDFARSEGYREIHGQVRSDNDVMLTLCAELGFAIAADARSPGETRVHLTISKQR